MDAQVLDSTIIVELKYAGAKIISWVKIYTETCERLILNEGFARRIVEAVRRV